jgi:ribonuclease HI
MTTEVYTDGACLGNPGPGGWAWAVPGGRFASGCEARSTNQRMEVGAVLDALRTLEGPVEVVSDSTYVVNCFNKNWWGPWLARGWLNSAKKPVANRDLWEPLIDLYQARGGPSMTTFRWVKGHSGDPMNDLVDRLAVEAAETQRPRSGAEPPTVLGRADEPGGASGRTRAGATSAKAVAKKTVASGEATAAEAVALPGHPVVVFGHRPPELGGYDDNPLADAVRDRLGEILTAKAALEDDLTVVSGLRLGAEMLGAEAAVARGLPLVAVLPYPDPQKVWSAAARDRFAVLVEKARDVITLQRKGPKTKQEAGAALARRDAWLARHAAEAVLVWDGADSGLRRLHRSLEDHLGEDVWVLDPGELAVPGA